MVFHLVPSKGKLSTLSSVISNRISIYEQLPPTMIKTWTEQYDCLVLWKEPSWRTGGLWRKGDGQLRDADTKRYCMPPPVVMKFLHQKNNRKRLAGPLVNVTRYCCRRSMYRRSLEANLSPLMLIIMLSSTLSVWMFVFHVPDLKSSGVLPQ